MNIRAIIMPFVQQKRVNREMFGISIHRIGIGIISQFSYVYAHFTHYQWVKHGLILPKTESYYFNWT